MNIQASTTVRPATRTVRHLCFVLFGLAALASDARGDDSQSDKLPANDAVDTEMLKSLPVYHEGRAKPFDSFARLIMAKITDRVNKSGVTLNIGDYLKHDQAIAKSEYAGAQAIFPDGGKRTFEASELVLSWLVEPEKWETVPFLYAPHEELREIVGVPVRNDRNDHLKYVSPAQVAASEELMEYFRQFEEERRAARSRGEELEEPEQEKAKLAFELMDRYTAFRALTLNSKLPLTNTIVRLPGSRTRFMDEMNDVVELLQTPNKEGTTFVEVLQKLASFAQAEDSGRASFTTAAEVTLQAIGSLYDVYKTLDDQKYANAQGGKVDLQQVSFEDVRAAADNFRRATKMLAAATQENMDAVYASTQSDPTLNLFRDLDSKSKDLARKALQLHVALFEDGEDSTLYVVPAVDTPALAKNRDMESRLQPWLSLQSVLHGVVTDPQAKPPAYGLLDPDHYPRERVEDVRTAWDELAGSYTNRRNTNREEACEKAQKDLATALRKLAEEIEPTRRRVAKEGFGKDEYDADQLAYTEYPDDDRMSLEVTYNELSPFNKSWMICLLGAVCYALSFGRARKPMFWTATAIMVIGILWSAYAFYLRVAITQWAPVTTMWETVVFVPFVVSVLGIWFLLLPILWPGLSDAWRLNAIPVAWEAKPLTAKQHGIMSAELWTGFGWALMVARLGMMAFIVWFLAFAKGYSDGGRVIINPLPSLGEGANMLNDLMVWLVGIVCLIASAWLLPRLALTMLAAVVFVPINLRRGDASVKMVKDTYGRNWFGLAAALVAAFFFCIASYVRVLDPSFKPLQPVLRSNFWLTIHVMTIVASYGAGMLAWGLGMVGLTFCLFGRYRNPVVHKNVKGLAPADGSSEHVAMKRRPPEGVSSLAHYAYRAIQVAVLLLAIGTILGGLWADVSWGRFWGWDPKEVWALISLLVYLAILHGRFAGWFNNFGLLAGTVLGFTAIAFSWYGVNFILPEFAGGNVGLHSYGVGAGGMWFVIGFGSLNLIYLGIVTARHWAETARRVTPEEVDQPPVAAQLIEQT